MSEFGSERTRKTNRRGSGRWPQPRLYRLLPGLPSLSRLISLAESTAAAVWGRLASTYVGSLRKIYVRTSYVWIYIHKKGERRRGEIRRNLRPSKAWPLTHAAWLYWKRPQRQRYMFMYSTCGVPQSSSCGVSVARKTQNDLFSLKIFSRKTSVSRRLLIPDCY